MATLNLDVFEEKTNEIELGKKTFVIPEQPSVGLMLALQDLPEGIEGMEKGLKLLHKVFQIHQAIEYEDFSLMFNMKTYVAVLNFVLAGISAEETKEMLAEAAEPVEGGKKKPELLMVKE